MKEKIMPIISILIMIITLLLITNSIGISSAEQNLTYEAYDTKIIIHFIPPLNKLDKVYLNNEEAEFIIYDYLVLHDLKPGTDYGIRVDNKTSGDTYHFEVTTSGMSYEKLGADYGIILLLMLLIIVIPFIPYSGYIVFMISFSIMLYAVESGMNDKITIGLFMLIIAISITLEWYREQFNEMITRR